QDPLALLRLGHVELFDAGHAEDRLLKYVLGMGNQPDRVIRPGGTDQDGASLFQIGGTSGDQTHQASYAGSELVGITTFLQLSSRLRTDARCQTVFSGRLGRSGRVT